MLFDERHEPLALSTIEPDDRGEIGELFRAEVENLARQFTVDATRIEHQNLVLELLRLRFVQEPKLARYRARIKEIAPDRNYRFDMATLYEIAPQARFLTASGRRLRRHDEACAASNVEVGVEIGNPDVITVGDLAAFIHAGETIRQTPIATDFVGVDFIDVEG